MSQLLECGARSDLSDALGQQVARDAAGIDELGQVGDGGPEPARDALGGDRYAAPSRLR
jgi:hypothetical protein